MATIELRDVSKVFPATRERPYPVTALDGVSLTIPDGKTMALLGPSGCGKSTLLRVVAGLTEYEGQVFYDDQKMEDVPPKDRYIGMVFENYALYPHLPGYGNLKFFFKVRKRPPVEASMRIQETAELMGFGFEQLLRRRPGQLSGGQQQRLAIARALVRDPKVMLFDEPLAQLDAQLRDRTRGEIRRLLSRFSITTLYVTHDQMEAVALGDAIAVMHAGRVEQVGSYEALTVQPANAFVAGFVGSPPMNMLPGSVVDGALRLASGGDALALPPDLAAQVRAGQALLVGIHAADVVHAAGADAPAGLRLAARVALVTPDFGRRRQMVQLDVGDAKLTWSLAEDLTLRTGDAVSIVLPLAHLYFFDAESGRRLSAD